MSSVLGFFASHSLLTLFVAVFVEQVGAPIPAFPFLLLAGADSTHNTLYAVWALLLAAVASMLADLVWFMAGRHYGHRILALLCKVSISPDNCIRKSELSFAKAGVATLVMSKFIPGLSTFAPPMAGAMGMRLGVFVLFNLAGSLLWAGCGIVLGVLFHNQIQQLLQGLEAIGAWALVVMGVVLALYIAYRLLRRWNMNRLRARTPRMLVDELLALMDSDKCYVILDMRGELLAQQDTNSISGAQAMEVKQLSSDVPVHWRSLDVIITFCACPNDATAVKAASILRAQGFNAFVLQGGIAAWQSHVGSH